MYQGSRSFFDLCPRSLRMRLVFLFASKWLQMTLRNVLLLTSVARYITLRFLVNDSHLD